MESKDKKTELEKILRGLGGAAVAFSGGVDSTFLLKTAHDLLGDQVIAITARTDAFPERELSEAEAFCQREGIRHLAFDFDALGAEGFASNPPDRCYLCKKAIFGRIIELAGENGAAHIVEGSNRDDDGDYRPGLRAIRELGVRSPLREAGLTKAEIRSFSREMGLDTWNKQSFACLATRIPYGEKITAKKLDMIGSAEQFLLDCGFRQVRVRLGGHAARIEILPEEFPKIIREELRERIDQKFRALGFHYVTLDIRGYRSGSMNEGLEDRQ